MLTLSSPLRLGDLSHTQNSILEIAERIGAWSRLPPEHILPIEPGLLLNQHRAVRRWELPTSATVQRSHLINLGEQGEYGIHALVNDALGPLAAGEYVLLCPWPSIPQAAEYLRSKCLGPVIQQTYQNGALRMHVSRALSALQIPERPPNDATLPSYTKIRWGWTLRLDADTARHAIVYFNLVTSDEPAVNDLGGNAFIVHATSNASNEPLRILLVDHWDLQGAHRELARWLKTTTKCKQQQ